MSRINPWADPEKRAAIMRGIKLAGKKRRGKPRRKRRKSHSTE